MERKTFVIPTLGTVEFEDDLVYYDGPVLFTVRSENGGRYIGFWASETSSESVYWYTPISDKRYRQLLRGELEVRRAFTEPDLVLETRVGDRGEVSQWISSAALDADALPESNYRFTADEFDQALSAGFIETAHVLAVRAGRAVARFVFDYGEGVHEGPAAAIASAVLYAQRVVDAIAYSKASDPKAERGSIPHEITESTLLALRPVRASSLGIELVARHDSDMWQESVAGQSLETLLDLLQSGADQERLKDRFSPLIIRAASSYRNLLKSLAKSGANVAVEVGVPRAGGEKRMVLSKDLILEMVDAMAAVERSKSIEHAFDAVLVGYDFESRAFHIRRTDDGTEYKGKATGKAAETAKTATLSKRYWVQLLESIDYDSVTEEPTSHFELIELTDAAAD